MNLQMLSAVSISKVFCGHLSTWTNSARPLPVVLPKQNSDESLSRSIKTFLFPRSNAGGRVIERGNSARLSVPSPSTCSTNRSSPSRHHPSCASHSCCLRAARRRQLRDPEEQLLRRTPQFFSNCAQLFAVQHVWGARQRPERPTPTQRHPIPSSPQIHQKGTRTDT